MVSKFPDSIEELAESPEKYGLPTFEQFCKNKEFWTGRYDDKIASIDNGDPILGCRQKYRIAGYDAESLEQCERIAKNMGLSIFSDFLVDPQLKPDQDGNYVNVVSFNPKKDVKRR